MTNRIHYVDRYRGGSYYRRIGMYIEYSGALPPKGIELVKNTIERKCGIWKSAQVVGWSNNKEIPIKTKEIDVWVDSDKITHNEFYVYDYEQRTKTSMYKAKLVIEIPEKKIDITESALDTFLDNIQSGMLISQAKENLGFK